MPLTDVAIRKAKPSQRAQKLSDAHGLYLEIRPNGSRLWRYQYRINGKPNVFAIGAYPEMSLADARAEHGRARELVKRGVHPSHERARSRSSVVDRNADTFKAIAEEWIRDKRPSWTPYYVKQIESYFRRDVYPKIGRRPIRTITSNDILKILKSISDRGAKAAAIFVRQVISQVFIYAVRSLRAESDPTHVLRGLIVRGPIQHADAKTADEIADLARRLASYAGARMTIIAMRLLLLLFVRTGELRKAEWSEFDFDRALWTIPAARMKKRRVHLVPLPRQALSLLLELRNISGANPHLFPNQRRPSDVISTTTINRALERMGYPSGYFTGHDFRATASTHLHEMGYREELVEMQLAHAKRDKTAAVYNHAKYLPERTAMMQAWADWIESIVSAKK